MSEKIIQRNLADACEEWNKIFGANKNIYRIIPFMQDGLKPVERRFLYNLYTDKGRSKFIKMAKAASDTVAAFHPHSNSSVEDVGAKMASPIKNNAVTVEGQGHFGSYKNEKAAAGRYIECKLSQYAKYCFFNDFKDSNVDMRQTYTGDDYEPEVLPSRYPHALINPQLSGIGYAFSSNIPPFNLSEVFNAAIKLIKNPDSKILLVPDSPTGADIIDDGQFDAINKDGCGTFTLKGSVEIDELSNTITITSIPLQTTIDAIIRNIANMREQHFSEIKEIKDYTKNKTGVRTVLYLEPNANPHTTIEKLYKKGTGLKKTYPVGMKMIDDYKDYDYGVKSFLIEWIKYRRDTVRSMFNTRLVRKMEESHMNDIMIFICNDDNAEQTAKMSRDAKDEKDFASKLIKKYNIDSHQANTISEMKMKAFNKEAYQRYLRLRTELTVDIKELETILSDDINIDNVIIEQLKEGMKLFGRPRMSRIVRESKEIEKSDHYISISRDGYIKKLPASINTTGQVGQGNSQYTTIYISNISNLFIFDIKGMVYRVDVNTIPDMSDNDIGIPLERYFKGISEIVNALDVPNDLFNSQKINKNMFITMVSQNGYAKRTSIAEFSNLNGATTAMRISADDMLVGAEFTVENSTKDIVLFTNKGNGLRRSVSELPILKAGARGVKQLDVIGDDHCIGFDIIKPAHNYIFYITSSGRVKITEMKYFPSSKRKGEIVSLINLEKNEELVGLTSVTRESIVHVYRKKGEPVEIKISDLQISTRASSGDKLVKTPRGDRILSIKVH